MPKPIQKNNKKAFNSAPITPPQCPSTEQSQSRNESWGTKPPEGIWTRRFCGTCPPHPIPKKGRDWPIFGKALFPWHGFLPFCSSEAASATSCTPRGNFAAQIAGSKEGFPGELAQAGLKHRMARLRGISGRDQSRGAAQVSRAASVSPTSDKALGTACPGATARRLPRPISAGLMHHANSSPRRLSCLEAISTYTSNIWSICYALQLRSRHSHFPSSPHITLRKGICLYLRAHTPLLDFETSRG